MSDLPALLTNAGLRLTPQRLTLLDLLCREGGHLTADDLYRRARRALPGLSATSIYKSLGALRAAGLVREVYVDGGPVRYDANFGQRHHHRVCHACGRIDDVACGADALGACVAPHPLGGFLVEAVDITYRGQCDACRSGRGDDTRTAEAAR